MDTCNKVERVLDRIKMETTEGQVRVGVRRVTARDKFEMTVGDQLVHSRAGGDGMVDSDSKLSRIMAAIVGQVDSL